MIVTVSKYETMTVIKDYYMYIAASKTLNCHWARTTMSNIRTFVLND